MYITDQHEAAGRGWAALGNLALGPMRIALDLERNFLVQISGSSDQAASGAVGLLGGRCDHTVHTVNSGRWRFKSESACPRAGHGSSRKSTRTCNRDIFLSHPVRHGPSALSVGYESELRRRARARSVEVEHTWGRGTAGLSRGYLEGSGTGGHGTEGTPSLDGCTGAIRSERPPS